MKKIIKVLQVKHNNGEDQRLYPMKRNIRNHSYSQDKQDHKYIVSK